MLSLTLWEPLENLNHFTITTPLLHFRQYYSFSLINRGIKHFGVSNLAERASHSLKTHPRKHPHLLPLNLSSFLPNAILNNIQSKGNKYMEEQILHNKTVN